MNGGTAPCGNWPTAGSALMSRSSSDYPVPGDAHTRVHTHIHPDTHTPTCTHTVVLPWALPPGKDKALLFYCRLLPKMCLVPEDRSQQTFSVKGLAVNTLDFAGHSLCCIFLAWFFVDGLFRRLKTILSPRALQKQVTPCSRIRH